MMGGDGRDNVLDFIRSIKVGGEDLWHHEPTAKMLQSLMVWGRRDSVLELAELRCGSRYGPASLKPASSSRH